MADKVYPSANKPTTTTANPAVSVAAKPAIPTKQQYSAARAAYRPQPPPRRRHGRSCCCSICLWCTLLLILILLIAAVAGGLFYFIYRPHRPSFSVASLRLSKFNLTDTAVTSNFNFTLTAHNPNKRISFTYDPIVVKFFSVEVAVGEGTFAGFVQGKRNVTTLRSVVSNSGTVKEGSDDVAKLRSSLRSRSLLPIRIQLDSKVKAKIGRFDTKKVAIRVTCDGIRVSLPSGKTASSLASTANVKCEVDPRFKIIKWTV